MAELTVDQFEVCTFTLTNTDFQESWKLKVKPDLKLFDYDSNSWSVITFFSLDESLPPNLLCCRWSWGRVKQLNCWSPHENNSPRTASIKCWWPDWKKPTPCWTLGKFGSRTPDCPHQRKWQGGNGKVQLAPTGQPWQGGLICAVTPRGTLRNTRSFTQNWRQTMVTSSECWALPGKASLQNSVRVHQLVSRVLTPFVLREKTIWSTVRGLLMLVTQSSWRRNELVTIDHHEQHLDTIEWLRDFYAIFTPSILLDQSLIVKAQVPTSRQH